jgi:superfamily II DNA or RNA helicase
MNDYKTTLTNGIIAGFIDENVECRRDLMPSMLSNDRKNGKRVLSDLHFELNNCTEFWFSVAFVTSSGVMCIIELLKELEEKGIPGKILVSKYQNFTEPEALKKLLRFKNIQLRISETDNFHAKAYIFRNSDGYNLIVGSSNLTSGALSVNKEWNLKVSSTQFGKLIIETLKEFKKEFEDSTVVDYLFIDRYQKEYDILKYSIKLKLDSLISEGRQIVPNSMQKKALERLEYLRKIGKNKALLISATGTGKTFLSAFDVKSYSPKRFLFIVHRGTIANEAMKSFKKIIGDSVTMGVFSGSRKDIKANYIFSTVQTISKQENFELFERDHFDYIVIDETHRSGAESYQRIMKYFNPKFLLGMTATPERTDGFDIFKQFEYNIAYEVRLNHALEEKMLCPFHYYGVTDVTVNGKLVEEDAAFNLLTSNERINRIIETTKFYGCDDGKVRGLVFCRSINECQYLSEAFNKRGFRTKALTGENSNEEREEAIESLELDNNKLDYIFSVDIFNEGVDIPRVNQIILLRPTQSAIIFVQQLGRGLRKKEGKEYLTVIDFIGNYSNNYLIPIALFGDRSYERETLRKLVASGSSLIPGESTINFERIAREKIFDSINNSNWQRNKDFQNDYQLLKFRLGRVPLMTDFVQNDSRNPYQYVEHYKSYYNFLLRQEEHYQGQLSPEQAKCLQYLSLEVLNAVRYGEIVLFRELLNQGVISFNSLNAVLTSEIGITINEETWKSVIENINLRFVRESEKGKQIPVGDKYKISILEVKSMHASFTEKFKDYLENEHFRVYINDLVSAADLVYKGKFLKSNYQFGFILYERYSRKDVFRILNWKENPVAQNVGGYMISTNRKDMAIFVTYHKDEEISSSIKYEEKFISKSVFEWMSKNRRTLNSPEIIALQNYPNMLVPLFVKKSDDEGTEFYYLGMMKPIKDSFTQTTIKGHDGTHVPAVTVQFNLQSPVEDNLYQYLTKT